MQDGFEQARALGLRGRELRLEAIAKRQERVDSRRYPVLLGQGRKRNRRVQPRWLEHERDEPGRKRHGRRRPLRDPHLAARMVIDTVESLVHRVATDETSDIADDDLAAEITRMVVAYLRAP